MSFAFRPGHPIKREIGRIIRSELDQACGRLRAPASESAIHDARKRVKKVEALVALLDQLDARPPRVDLDRLRAARQTLSRLRDADALIDTLQRVRSRVSRRGKRQVAAQIRSHFEREKKEIMVKGHASAGSLARSRNLLQRVSRAVKRWPIPSVDPDDLPAILGQSSRRMQKAMKRAQRKGRPRDFHDWRKRVKALWYQLRLSKHFAPSLGPRIAGLKKLQTTLGDEHNLFVLRGKLTRDPGLQPVRLRAKDIARRAKRLEGQQQRRALAHGSRLRTGSPKEFERDLRGRFKKRGR